MPEYTKDKPWVSDEIKGNKVECHEEGAIAICQWKNKDFNGKFHDVFELSSEKIANDKFKEKICFSEIGKNLVHGTELEKKIDAKTDCIELN